MVHHLRGETVELEAGERSLVDQDSDDLQERAQALLIRALVAPLRSDHGSVLSLATQAVDAVKSAYGMGVDSFRAAWPMAVYAALGTGAREEASAMVAYVESTPRGLVPPFIRWQASRFRAHLHALHDQEAAEQAFRVAIAGFEELGYPYWLAKTRAEHAEWMLTSGKPADAEPLLERALEVFERLGAVPDAASTRELLERSRG